MNEDDKKFIREELKNIGVDWKDVSEKLIALVKESTKAVTEVNTKLSRPIYHNPQFWFNTGILLIFFILAWHTVGLHGCLQIKDVKVGWCN